MKEKNSKKVIIKISFPIFLLIIFISMFLSGCILTPSKIIDKSDKYLDSEKLKVKGKITKIYNFPEKKYFVYSLENIEPNDQEKPSEILVLSCEEYKRNDNVTIRGKIFPVNEETLKDEKSIRDIIEKFLIKKSTIDEKALFLHSGYIYEFLKKYLEGNSDFILFFSYGNYEGSFSS